MDYGMRQLRNHARTKCGFNVKWQNVTFHGTTPVGSPPLYAASCTLFCAHRFLHFVSITGLVYVDPASPWKSHLCFPHRIRSPDEHPQWALHWTQSWTVLLVLTLVSNTKTANMSLSACAVVLPLRVLLTVLLLQGTPFGSLKGALSMTVLLPAQSRLELFNDTGVRQPLLGEIIDIFPSTLTESQEETSSQHHTSSGTSQSLHSGMTPPLLFEGTHELWLLWFIDVSRNIEIACNRFC